MRALVTNQRMLTWLCVYPLDNEPSVCEKVYCILFTMMVWFSNMSGILTSVAFLWKYSSVDLVASLYAVFQLIMVLAMTNVCVNIQISRAKIAHIFKDLSEIYEKNPKDEFLQRANDQCEQICQIFFKFVLIGYAASIIMATLITSLICVISTKRFDVQLMYHPNKVVLPWNLKTPLGYFFEICFDMWMGEVVWYSTGSLIILFISSCFHHQAFYKMFHRLVCELSESKGNRCAIDRLRRLHDFHGNVKGWFSLTSELYSPFLTVQLILTVIVMVALLFDLSMAIKHIDFDFNTNLMIFMVNAANLFLYCFFGRMATESFAQMSDSLFESNWYELPVDIQKHFVILIANAQIPMNYHGFGIAVLNLQTFNAMFRLVITYYMSLKALASF